MKFLQILGMICFITWALMSCNSSTPKSQAENKEKGEKVENAELSNTDTDSDQPNSSEATTASDTDQEAKTTAVNTLEGEEFPGNGYKGRYNDYIFYIEVSGEEISGFVRHKDSKLENPISGQMSSPFAFEAEELGEDADGDEATVAKLRAKIGSNGNALDLDYNNVNSSETFRVELKK